MTRPVEPEGPDLPERLGATGPGRALYFVGATGAFLAAPDLDLMALPLLHHRSILTHSLLLPLLVLWAGRRLGPGPAAGAFLGVAVHLSADLLSPARGFGQVWLPEPWQVPLGGWSHGWLALNALGGVVLAFRTLPGGGSPRWGLLALATGVAAALLYGLVNEGSWASAGLASAVVAGGWALHRRVGG